MESDHTHPHRYDTLEYKICYILDQMRALNLNLVTFLDGLLYGDEACTSNAKIRQTRTYFLNHPTFIDILSRCYKRAHKSNRTFRPASRAMRDFARNCIQEVCNDELDGLADHFNSDATISEAKLLETNFENLNLVCISKSPILYGILMTICTTSKQRLRNLKNTTANKIMVLIISIILYHRSVHNNVVQKLFSVYWIACGVPSRAWRLLHNLGLAMSATWSQNAIGTLTKDALARIRTWTANNPFAIIHDNINIAHRVSSQRLDHRNQFVNGTAFTVIPLPIETRTLFINKGRRTIMDRWQHASDKKTLDWDQIFQAAQSSEENARAFSVFHVIQFLFQHPTFSTWHEKCSHLAELGFPGPIDSLPAGHEHCTQNWLLRTVPVDESTLEGTVTVIEEVWKQLQFNNMRGRNSLATERLVPWIGDQKSASLLRGVHGLRGCDLNGFERVDYAIVLKGWFHEVMALQQQIHHKHLGNNSSTGLQRNITRLARIGLNPGSKTVKMDFHNLHELICFVLQARILDCWLVETGTLSLMELAAKNMTDGEIITHATKIVDTFASSRAIHDMHSKPKDEQDEVWLGNALFLRDALVYWEVTRAIKIGDVGRLANITPTLLLMFAGGGNSHYAFELLEEMQLEINELSADEVLALRHHCWLANTSGRRDGFFPMDQLQEHNIQDIKHIFAPRGSNASWDLLGRISPIIPTLRSVGRHIDAQFKVGARGNKHAEVSRWGDIDTLLNMYHSDNGMHTVVPGRKSFTSMPPDVIREGILDLSERSTLQNWRKSRAKYIHSYKHRFLAEDSLDDTSLPVLVNTDPDMSDTFANELFGWQNEGSDVDDGGSEFEC